ncbi:MAG: type II secretion system F family protein [Nitrososphaerota archaeon]|nr:type II secretion system F family protein [Nitrososphaerota archaeon]MDG7049057.1 type II secretion system F family protein [Nitrososphaerota archaeon]MDG7051664.1 type II secretion system F family protein [Nitrososphaerota archaeon]
MTRGRPSREVVRAGKIISVVAPIAAILYYLFASSIIPLPSQLVPPHISLNYIMVMVVVLMALPYGIVVWADTSYRREVDRYVPHFLSDLENLVKSGKGLLDSIEVIAGYDYGALSEELKVFTSQIKLGTPSHEAYNALIKRVSTTLVANVFSILDELTVSGGGVAGTLETLRGDISDLALIEKERTGTLRGYVTIIYISFFIFLAVMALLYVDFFVKMAATHITDGGLVPSFSINLPLIYNFLFQTSVISGGISGIAAGKISDGHWSSGIKHLLVFVIITVLLFQLYV